MNSATLRASYLHLLCMHKTSSCFNYFSCSTDYVEVFSVLPSPVDGSNMSKIAHFCGELLPGPILSHHLVNRLRVVFHSDSEKLSMGFVALYEFIPARPPNKGISLV